MITNEKEKKMNLCPLLKGNNIKICGAFTHTIILSLEEIKNSCCNNFQECKFFQKRLKSGKKLPPIDYSRLMPKEENMAKVAIITVEVMDEETAGNILEQRHNEDELLTTAASTEIKGILTSAAIVNILHHFQPQPTQGILVVKRST